jgi:hypothetical protein
MTELIAEIRRKVSEDQLEFSKHAIDQSILRKIRVQDIRDVITSGRIIEDYPDDKYGPSCLICVLPRHNVPFTFSAAILLDPSSRSLLYMSPTHKVGRYFYSTKEH